MSEIEEFFKQSRSAFEKAVLERISKHRSFFPGMPPATKEQLRKWRRKDAQYDKMRKIQDAMVTQDHVSLAIKLLSAVSGYEYEYDEQEAARIIMMHERANKLRAK